MKIETYGMIFLPIFYFSAGILGCYWLERRKMNISNTQKRDSPSCTHIFQPSKMAATGNRMWHRFRAFSPLLQSSTVIWVSCWSQWGYSTLLISQMSASPIRESRQHLLQAPRLLCPGTPIKCCQRRECRAANSALHANQGPAQLAQQRPRAHGELSVPDVLMSQERPVVESEWPAADEVAWAGKRLTKKASMATIQARRNTLHWVVTSPGDKPWQ